MKTKVKKFSHKLLALLMALVMGITCFSGVMTSFAATSNEVKYLDEDLEYNQLAWRMVSDEQTATAILDYLDDDLLPNTVAPMIENMLSGVNVNITAIATISYDLSSHILKLNFVLGAYKYDLYLNLNSIDEIIKTIDSLDGLLNNSSFSSMLPTLQYTHLTALKGMSRDKNTSCEILSGVLGLLRQISFNAGSNHTSSNVQNDILGEVLRGDAVLLTDTMKGLLGKVLASFAGISIDLDLYNLIGGFLNLDDGYESNLVYNVVKQILLDQSGFFTAQEVADYKNGVKEFNYDTILLEKLSTELLQKINVLVTYDSAYGTGDFDDDGNELTTTDNSANRKKAINALMYDADGNETGVTYEAACKALGYDPNLKYSTEITYDEEGNVIADYTGNILLFVYGDEKLALQANDTLMSFAYRALKMAWKTVLSGTVDLIHVNNSVDRGHGGNFDNVYYYWSQTNFTWNYDDVASNYSADKLNAWAEDVCEDYGTKDPAEFLGWVQDTFVYDRTALETSDGSWEDIDPTTLFGKLRYSPLADYGFDMQTGPINLYFLQTGTQYLDNFFNNAYDSYGSITAGLNDCLAALVKDIFAESDNVIGSLPELATTSSTDPTTIAKTLVDNALLVIEYTADATDENILKAFRENNQGVALSEANLEEAMMPMLMACVGQVNLGDAPLSELIHPEDWNACNDAEGLAYLCLREYLSYVQPGRDYSVLVNADGNGGYVGGTIEATLEGTIMPMARDALGYIMEPLVPLYDANGQRWSATSSAIDDTETTIFTLLNSVICYYANDYELKTGRTNGVAALLGICDTDGNSLIKPSNTIWENINLVANHLLPVFGELQYAEKGAKLDSQDFVWNDIVLSFLEIGNIQPSGLGGVGNFLERIITMFTAPAVSETKVVNTIYNFAADLINGIFGVRYGDEKQLFGTVVPATDSATPFDDVMQKNVLAGTDTQYNPGLIQKFLIRLAEASGYGGYGENVVGYFGDSFWRGATFAINSVVSFVPSLFPTLGDSAIKNGTASTSPSYITGASQGSSVSGTVTFKNNITGMNTAYVDENGTVQQNQRYTVKLTNAYVYEASNPNSKTAIPALSDKLLQPGETVSGSYTQQFYPSDGSTATYVTEIHYDYVYLNGDPINDIYGMTDTSAYTDLIANAFQYVGVMPSWADEIYPDGQYLGVTRTASGTTTTSIGQNSVKGTDTLNSNLTLSYPSDFLITTADPMAVSKYTFSVYNKNSSDKGMDGIYPFDNKTVVNAYNGQSVAVSGTNAKVAHDDEGNAIIYGSYDYRIGNGEWQRNVQTVVLVDGTEDKYKATVQEAQGYSLSEISSIKAALTEAEQAQFETRDHVIFTLDELNAKGMLQAVEMTDGVCTGLYIKSSTSNSISYKTPGLIWDGSATCYPYQYDTVLERLNFDSPIGGTYMQSGKVTAKSKAQTATLPFMVVSDRNALEPGVYPISMAAYSGGKSVTMDFNVVIVNDEMKNVMQDAYNDFVNTLAKYTPRDFADYNEAAGTSAAYAQAVADAKQALTTLSTPLTLQNRDEINSIYEAGVEAVAAAKTEMLAALDFTKAAKIVEQVSKVREPFNENNFNIITFNTMKNAAKDAESKYSLYISYIDNGETIEKSGLSYEDYKSYRDRAIAGDITFVGATADNVAPYFVTSELSSAEITEYIRLFNFYLNLMFERGYIGNQLEAEIECAGGAGYATFDVTPAAVDADGNITANATVKNTTIADPEFGKYVDGVLVNEGDVTYPTALWNNYVNRLAEAVEIAQLGNGSYAHKTEALYVVGADDYDANVTTCYKADSLLQIAEIALENTYVVDMQATEGGSVQMTYGDDASAETFTNAAKVAIPWKDSVTITPVAEEGYELEALTVNGEAVELDENGQYTAKVTADSVVTATFTGGSTSSDITVSGTVVIATDTAGTAYTKGIVGINILVNGEVVGTTNSDGTFTVTVPAGTTELVFAGSTTVDRTVTLSGDADVTDAIIPIVICDYNHDGDINAADKSTFLSSFSGAYNVYCDLNADGDVNAADKSYFLGFFGREVAYNDLAIG